MRFGTALRAAARELTAPPGARLRILEEVGADLEDLYAALRTAGVPESEARKRAAALLLPDRAAADALALVHRPLWVRWRERYGGRRHGGERLLLVGSAVLALAASVATLVQTGLSMSTSPFVVALFGVGGAAMLHAATKVVRVWGLGESDATRIRSGSGALLVAAVGAHVAAGFGVLYELRAVAARIVAGPELEGALLLEWLRASVVLGVLGLAISMACGLCWMLFVHRAAVVEMRERALLGPALRVVATEQANGNGRDVR